MYAFNTNLIIGFHGCDEDVCNALLNNPNTINKSEKPYDWLGHGVYFWENNYDRAFRWAKDKAERGEIKKPSVIGAVLNLGHCFDLLDTSFIKMTKNYFDLMEQDYKTSGKKLPQNKDIRNDIHKDKILRELDCAVIEYMHKVIETEIQDDTKTKGFSKHKRFDSARGVFTEGGSAFPGAGIQSKNHIQICVRNSNCIKGFFLPREEIDF